MQNREDSNRVWLDPIVNTVRKSTKLTDPGRLRRKTETRWIRFDLANNPIQFDKEIPTEIESP